MLYPFSPFSLNRRLFISIIVFIILISLFAILPVAAEFPPVWLKQDIYARYVNSNGPGARTGTNLKNEAFSYDYYRWECLSLEENVAVLDVSIVLNETTVYSGRFNVDIENRSVTFSNRTYIGKTWLWLPANPSPSDIIEVTDNQSQTPNIGGLFATCQGYQKIYDIGDPLIGGFYDLDTGLAMDLHTWNEPTLLAMGVRDIGIGLIAATNVDLGPREWWVDVVYSLPIVAPIIGFTGVFAFVWHRRQRKKKQTEALLKKQRKKPEN
jgi:hypothetical protein